LFPSHDRTAEANLSEQITATGQTVLRIVSALDSIHIANVDAGKGITLEELAEKKKQEEMKTV
jgi:adenine/guanine phosphoribosyltransferase-like PRPP-binding protein